MRKFLKNSIQFSCLAVLIVCLLQAFISFRIKDETVTGYDNWDTTKNLNADLVLMGSSRCWVQLDPGFFHKNYHLKTVNIGMNGHSEITASILRLKNYLSKNKPPKFALLSLDPFMSPGSIEKNTNFTNKNSYARFAFLPSKNNTELVNYFKFTPFEKYMPLYAIFKYQLFEDCISLNKSNLFKEGFERNDEQWDTLKYPIINIMKKYFIKPNQIKALSNSLQELHTLCKKHKIKLLCLQTPVYKIVHDETVFSRTATICKEANIPFIDINKETLRKNKNYFYNTTHLNKEGVNEMNKLLKNEKELDKFFKINP